MSADERGPELPGLEFQHKLGSGGFSDVYLYERQRPRMQVAVKVLKADIMDAAQRAQFVAEADTMGELAEHPYIVPVLGAGTASDGRPYLEMRYYPGPDLAERVKAQPLSVPDALKMGIQLASAIETAHRAGIIHRDIKPQNVLISSYGVPGLTDFGIAGRPGDADEDENVGVSMPWSPPEVLTGASNGSQASDVYSLGATLWNLLVGRSPFSIPGDDNSQRALFTRIVHSKPPMTGRADVPSSLERLLAQAMAKKPEHRPRSAMDLARHLQRVEQELRLARTEIVVLEHTHDAVRGAGSEPFSQTPTQTLPETTPEGAERTTLRVPVAPSTPVQGPPSGGSAPTARRPVRATTGDAPTTARPTRAAPGTAPGTAPGAASRAASGAAPTTARPTRPTGAPPASVGAGAASGAAPTMARPARAAAPAAAPTAARPVRADERPRGDGSEGATGTGRWLAIGAAVALLAASVAIGAFLSRGGDADEPKPGTLTQGGGASGPADVNVDLDPAIPVVRVVKVAGDKVTFAWDREQKGDWFQYEVVSSNGAVARQWKRTDKTSATVTALPDGVTCIAVQARRGTSGSTDAGRKCAR
ncbi:serine/threonine-protein kinase [Nocardioides jiangxiensis]|uniref:non-specific serine/threonine protein kinase n=1 Tax=Nocardioides jiangxiensis TaxID=3064524 RepID=A0ABT9AZF9_9ACTN|nr:serine/threonine-protein kinase [Nocardioides sp. WY-20]MDO7867835.1 protein kinase [Nocardioides sp. WY-20]